MSVSINIRKRNEDGKTWGNIPVMSFAGRTVGCVLSEMDGREVVAEIVSGNWRGYLCGTKQKNLDHLVGGHLSSVSVTSGHCSG